MSWLFEMHSEQRHGHVTSSQSCCNTRVGPFWFDHMGCVCVMVPPYDVTMSAPSSPMVVVKQNGDCLHLQFRSFLGF